MRWEGGPAAATLDACRRSLTGLASTPASISDTAPLRQPGRAPCKQSARLSAAALHEHGRPVDWLRGAGTSLIAGIQRMAGCIAGRPVGHVALPPVGVAPADATAPHLRPGNSRHQSSQLTGAAHAVQRAPAQLPEQGCAEMRWRPSVHSGDDVGGCEPDCSAGPPACSPHKYRTCSTAWCAQPHNSKQRQPSKTAAAHIAERRRKAGVGRFQAPAQRCPGALADPGSPRVHSQALQQPQQTRGRTGQPRARRPTIPRAAPTPNTRISKLGTLSRRDPNLGFTPACALDSMVRATLCLRACGTWRTQLSRRCRTGWRPAAAGRPLVGGRGGGASGTAPPERRRVTRPCIPTACSALASSHARSRARCASRWTPRRPPRMRWPGPPAR